MALKSAPRSRRKPSEILCAMTGAQATVGGIAAANVNMLYALIAAAQENRIALRIFSFLEHDSDRPAFVPASVQFSGFAANKIQFTGALVRGALRRPLFCFDHVSLALPVLALTATGLAQTVICAHGSESWRRLRRVNRWGFENASLCLTNSHFTLNKMRERMPEIRAAACPLGLSAHVELNRMPSAKPSEPVILEAADGQRRVLGARVLLLVGRMHPSEREKGHYPLVKALPRVLESFADVQLVFAGPGDDRENLRLLAQARGAGAAVFLPGWLDRQTLQRLYQHCYAFVMPSLQEGFGLAYLEAMNCAKPCVGCYDQGAQDIIVDGETGFLIRDPNHADELVAVLLALLKDPCRARQMGERGLARLHEQFTARHHQQRVKEQILTLL